MRPIVEKLPMARRNKDLPRGRQRSGWKAEFLEATGKAPVDLGDLSDEDFGP